MSDMPTREELEKRILELEKNEDTLQQEKDFLDKLTNSLGDAVFSLKMPERVLDFVNPAVESLFGYSRKECIGMQPSMFYPDQEGFHDFGKILKWAEEQKLKILVTERMLMRKNGELLPCETTTTFFRKNNKCEHAISIVRDMTDRNQATATIRASEQRLQLAVEGADLGMWDWNMETNEVYFNPRYLSMLGYGPTELPHTLATWEHLLHSEDKKSAEQQIFDCIENRSGKWSIEFRLRAKDGQYLWILGRGKVVEYSADGSPLRATGTHLNITAFKKAEDELEQRVLERTEELRETHRQLLHAEKLSAIGNLSASIAHEFNNPLYGIQSVIEGIKRNFALDAEFQELADLALSECGRIKSLIKKLQDFNKPSSGVKEAVNIHALVDEMVTMVKKEYNAANITINKQYASDLFRSHVVPDQMKQVLLNLLTNSKDAMMGKSGEVTVTTENLGSKLAIRIKDTGSGIAAVNLPNIFEPFFTTKSAIKGTGLGLSISYGIIRGHGGDIEVDSVPNQGTTVSILLPLNENTNDQTIHITR